MNRLIGEKYITVEGREKALELADVLLKNNYQVFIQHDDLDIWLIGYTSNDLSFGDDRYALITLDEEEQLQNQRECHQLDESIKAAKKANEEAIYDSKGWENWDGNETDEDEDEDDDDRNYDEPED